LKRLRDRVVQTDTVLPGMDYVQGVVKMGDGMILSTTSIIPLTGKRRRLWITTIMNNTKGAKDGYHSEPLMQQLNDMVVHAWIDFSCASR